MSLDDGLFGESNDELMNKLRNEITSLNAINDTLVQSIHALSGELLKRKNLDNSPSSSGYYSNSKRFKISESPINNISTISSPSINNNNSNTSTCVNSDSSIQDDICLPNELLLNLFKYLDREDLDSCSLVCKRWLQIIDKHENKLARRQIRLLKIFETVNNTSTITISATTKTKSLKYNLVFGEQNPDQSIHIKISQMLKYSKIRRTIICSFDLKGVIAHDLVAIFKRSNIKFCRLELIGLSLRQISAETFQRLIGEQFNAEQYFIDGIRDADPDHFNSKLFEKPAIASAEDITVYDVTSINDDDVILDVGDDVLLDFIFGKNTLSIDRSSLYLDSPAVSQSFVYNALVRFAQETDLTRALPHAEFAHCRAQTVNTNRNIRNEYDTDVQSEWSAANKRNNSVLEAKVAKSTEDDEFVHITLTIVTPHSRIRA